MDRVDADDSSFIKIFRTIKEHTSKTENESLKVSFFFHDFSVLLTNELFSIKLFKEGKREEESER